MYVCKLYVRVCVCVCMHDYACMSPCLYVSMSLCLSPGITIGAGPLFWYTVCLSNAHLQAYRDIQYLHFEAATFVQ